MPPKSIFLATLGFALSATPAMAGTSTGSMPVLATVLEACTITATPMLFGNVSPGSGNIDTSATVALVCTPNADFDILMGNGSNASSGQRRLANTGASEFISYGLFQDSAYTQSWGSTIGTNTLSGTAGALGVVSYPVYGRIPSSAAPVSAGAYSDTVTVTVNF